MADPNNIPQAAQQLKEELSSQDEETTQKAKSEVAQTDFDKEYEIAKQNETGSSTGNPKPSQGNVDDIDSPGDSDPDDYLDMAKDITKNVESNK